MDPFSSDPGGNAAMRLSFSYTGSEVSLASALSLEMPTPPSDPIEHGEEAGFWYELRGDSGPLYRRVMQNPLRYDAEVFTEEAGITRQALPEIRGSFDLVAPQLAGMRTIALFSSPLDPESFGQPAAQIAEIDLGSITLETPGGVA